MRKNIYASGFPYSKNMANFEAGCLNFMLSTNPEIRRSVTYTYLARVSLSYHIGSSCCIYNNTVNPHLVRKIVQKIFRTK